mmetsp:Transcript_69418/g.206812  ORF Transcript_69418/g.206812 Transcript_69418/m.206812 type:complete len:243 (+) Transcript_69418:65-793(+)
MAVDLFSSSRSVTAPCPPKVLLAPPSENLAWDAAQLAFFCSPRLQHRIFGMVGTYVDIWSDFEAAVERRRASYVAALRRVDPRVHRVRLQRVVRRVPDVELPTDGSSWALLTQPRGALTLDADGARVADVSYLGGRLPQKNPPMFDFNLEPDRPERTYVLRLHQTFFAERIGDQVRWTSELFALHVELLDHRLERESFWAFEAWACHPRPRRQRPVLRRELVGRVRDFLFAALAPAPAPQAA